MQGMIVVVNAGSSSIKFALFSAPGRPSRASLLSQGGLSGIGQTVRFRASDTAGAVIADQTLDATTTHEGAVDVLLGWLDQNYPDSALLAAGHRVVQGGKHYCAPVLIDAAVIEELRQLIPLAPLHQPHHIAAIEALLRRHPGMLQVACFDTAFHHGQADVVTHFALPRALTADGVRRYGFHGLSYEYIASVMADVMGASLASGRVVVAHLGAGASMCAMRDGKSVATTMGFTTLDGLPMGSRCGDLDPGVVLYLMQQKKMSADAVSQMLYHDSGLLGMSGISDDMQTLMASNDAHAVEAVALFVYRIGRELGSLAAALGGIDALVFTGGIGEHAVQIRRSVCIQAAWLGLELDNEANQRGAPRLSLAESRVSAWLIPTDEDLMIARHTSDFLPQFPPPDSLTRNAMDTTAKPQTAPAVKNDEAHIDQALDEALKESFPSSDPVAISVPKPSSTPL